MHLYGDAEVAQLRLVADAAEHKQLGRVEAARGQDDLSVRPDGLGLPAALVFHAHRAALVEDNAVDLGVDQDRDVLPCEDGVQESARHAVTAAVLDDLVLVGETLAGDLAFAVEVIEHGQPELAETFQARGRHGQRVGRGLNPDRASRAAEGRVGLAAPVLDALEEPQPVLVAPPGVAGFRGPVI